jgi:hypothetical protein
MRGNNSGVPKYMHLDSFETQLFNAIASCSFGMNRQKRSASSCWLSVMLLLLHIMVNCSVVSLAVLLVILAKSDFLDSVEVLEKALEKATWS